MSWIVTIAVFASALFVQKYATYTAPPELYVPQVHEVYAHDPDSFTQGLVWHEGTFYESAGLYGESDVRQVDPEFLAHLFQDRRIRAT